MTNLVEMFDPTDKIEITGKFNSVQVRSATWVEKSGVIVGKKEYHRIVYNPGDVSENETVQSVINAVHTQDVIDQYKLEMVKEDK